MVLVLGLLGTPAASAQSSLSFSAGFFNPIGVDSRTPDDVLVNNLDFLAFNVGDFRAGSFGAEYLAGLGNFFEAGLGIGYQQRTVPTVYLDFVNSDGSEIEQNLKLSVVPMTATFRVLPLGHHDAITPYIGAGIGVFHWRYSETGQFIATDNSIFQGTFTGTGNATGPVIVGGLRVPAGQWGFGFDVRYQNAKGDLPLDQGFAGTKIDLTGFTYSFTANVRF